MDASRKHEDDVKVLFVCEGNKMRSPMAEAFYNSLTNSHDATSAGCDPYPLGGSFPEVIAAMKEKGVTLDHSSQLVTQAMIDAADKVITFPTSLMPDFVAKNPKTVQWDISDPYYQPKDGADHLRHARDKIDQLVRQLVNEETE